MYIALGLGLALMLILFGFRFLRKRRIKAVRDFEISNREYLRLQEENDRIMRERASIEIEHPYQKLIAAKLKLKRALQENNSFAEERNRTIIENILAEYETDEDKLSEAYSAQIEAMNLRLSEIELKQRQMRLHARRNAFSLKNLFDNETG